MHRIKIAIEKQTSETDKAFVFRFVGGFISIPKSQIQSIKGGTIRVEDFSTACYVITVTDWIYSKIESDLKKLTSKYNYKYLNN